MYTIFEKIIDCHHGCILAQYLIVSEAHLEKLKENMQLEPTHEKEYKLIKDVPPSEVETIFTDYTNQDYDFESMHEIKIRKSQTSYYMIFSKKLNKGEVSFLERLSMSLR